MFFAKELLEIERSKPLSIAKAWIFNLKGSSDVPLKWSLD